MPVPSDGGLRTCGRCRRIEIRRQRPTTFAGAGEPLRNLVPKASSKKTKNESAGGGKQRRKRQRHRNAFPSHFRKAYSQRGSNRPRAALAEIFVTIEHLYHYALSLGGGQSESDNVLKVKKAIFRLLPSRIRRELDRVFFETGVRRNRISRSHAWNYRLRKRQRTGEPKKLSDLPRMLPRYPNTPTKPIA